jgi:hypothetical protein
MVEEAQLAKAVVRRLWRERKNWHAAGDKVTHLRG